MALKLTPSLALKIKGPINGIVTRERVTLFCLARGPLTEAYKEQCRVAVCWSLLELELAGKFDSKIDRPPINTEAKSMHAVKASRLQTKPGL